MQVLYVSVPLLQWVKDLPELKQILSNMDPIAFIHSSFMHSSIGHIVFEQLLVIQQCPSVLGTEQGIRKDPYPHGICIIVGREQEHGQKKKTIRRKINDQD